ncbi:DinB/UmuC family translesion DNA polymerase [Novosphingobium terrae]|uniref:DinB/UmuC family translesion DNA polymerase n=1 Tax=Novosphingobium terrae TaxID=2726189 RepID=UPI00198016AA|nr:hypothetical protein [Novosphingobium terrae]
MPAQQRSLRAHRHRQAKFKEFRIITLSRSDTGSITNKALLLQTSLDLVRSIFPPEMGIRLVGVTVSNFGMPAFDGEPPLPLFLWNSVTWQPQRRSLLEQAVR